MANHPGRINDLIKIAHHTAICVDDFEAARDFYLDILGFEVEGEMDQRSEPALGRVVGLPGAVVRWAMLKRDNYRVEVFKYYTPEGRKEPNRQCDSGYTHMAFEVSDVEECYRRVVAAGFRTNAPPQELRGGYSKVIYVLAPEGNVTELLQFFPEKLKK